MFSYSLYLSKQKNENHLKKLFFITVIIVCLWSFIQLFSHHLIFHLIPFKTNGITCVMVFFFSSSSPVFITNDIFWISSKLLWRFSLQLFKFVWFFFLYIFRCYWVGKLSNLRRTIRFSTDSIWRLNWEGYLFVHSLMVMVSKVREENSQILIINEFRKIPIIIRFMHI